MTCYIVTFEVETKETRDKLREALKKYRSFCPIHRYCWAIMTDEKASQVRSDLSLLLQPTDRLFVIRSGTEAAWFNSYGEKNDTWLKKNL